MIGEDKDRSVIAPHVAYGVLKGVHCAFHSFFSYHILLQVEIKQLLSEGAAFEVIPPLL